MENIKDLIEKYTRFTTIQESKITFIGDILNCFRSEFLLLSPKECKKYKEYLQNIYNNISTIQDIVYICKDEIDDLYLKCNSKNIDCILYTKIMGIKVSLEIIADKKCQYCLDVLEKCLSKVV